MESLLADIRYGSRMLIKRPGFTAVAIVTLALGIGANVAIFSVVNAVLLNPLPYANPSELTVIWLQHPTTNQFQQPASFPDFSDWQAQSRSFERLVATRTVAVNLTDGDEPERVTGARVSAGFISMFRATPVAGRDFLESETLPGGAAVALIGFKLWQERYGGDPSLIGRAVSIDNITYTIVGVLPKSFYYPTPETQIYIPLMQGKNETARGSRFLRVTARLKPGVSLVEAQAEMDAITGRIAEQFADSNAGVGVQLVPLHEQVVGKIRPALMILFGAAGCVLLIACANVANLLLARASARRAELAVRTALGATRLRLIRQLLTECLLLSSVGGLLGMVIAMWGVPALTSISASSIPRVEEVSVSLEALLFTLVISIATGILFGVAPALKSSSKRLTEDLKEGRRGATGGAMHQRLLNLLVAAEVALAVVLLAGTGLLVRSFISISGVQPGFNPKGVLTIGIGLTQPLYADIEQQAKFYERLTEKVSAIPGVVSVAGINRVPLLGFNASTSFTFQGKPVQAGSEPTADCRIATPNYFKTMGIPLLNGREFNERDVKDSPEVVVINHAMADQFLPGEDPIGKRLQIYPNPPRWREVVGVAADVKLMGLDADVNPVIYVPVPQNPYAGAMRSSFLAVRSSGDPVAVTAAIRREMKTVDSGVPVAQVRFLDDIVADSVAPQRLNMWLLVAFAGLAAALAAVGIYGVMAYSVTERTHEIGVRMALGAASTDMLQMVLVDGAKVTMAGVIAGLAAAFALTRAMSSLLYKVSASDPITFAGISALIACVSLLASYIPARKASRVDPMVALRYD
ncbi:MAG TPA: ABC transporter permease [Blastocatellia bacterium]|nr:ABC transporter permease [Blastocatellia bacterium]